MPKGEFEVILSLAVFVNALEHQRLEIAAHGIRHVDLDAAKKDNASWQVVVLGQDPAACRAPDHPRPSEIPIFVP